MFLILLVLMTVCNSFNDQCVADPPNLYHLTVQFETVLENLMKLITELAHMRQRLDALDAQNK